MELELSLGERASKSSFGFIEEARAIQGIASLGFSMGLSVNNNPNSRDYKRKQEQDELEQDENEEDDEDTEEEDQENRIEEKTINKPFLHYQQQTIICSEESPLIQLDLLPNTPVPRHNHHEDRAAVSCSPPNSGASSFQMDFGTYNKNGNIEGERGSDEDENGCSRKKLRLSKQQSAFLEESFKEHHTLNPKQKLALAKQLNLRPRQVEVWFQNRRARTKLKQTEVDCEFLKRCCERLTQENSKLRKELQELRALKSSNPFNMHLPATTLTMCPSCERVATAPANPTTTNSSPEPAATSSKATDFDLSLSTRTRFLPFNHPRIS